MHLQEKLISVKLVERSVRMSFSEDEISAVMNRLNTSFDNDCCALEKSIKSQKAKIGKPCMNSTLRTKAKFEESLSKKAQKIRNFTQQVNSLTDNWSWYIKLRLF